jgi:hypothetical protein
MLCRHVWCCLVVLACTSLPASSSVDAGGLAACVLHVCSRYSLHRLAPRGNVSCLLQGMHGAEHPGSDTALAVLYSVQYTNAAHLQRLLISIVHLLP